MQETWQWFAGAYISCRWNTANDMQSTCAIVCLGEPYVRLQRCSLTSCLGQPERGCMSTSASSALMPMATFCHFWPVKAFEQMRALLL